MQAMISGVWMMRRKTASRAERLCVRSVPGSWSWGCEPTSPATPGSLFPGSFIRAAGGWVTGGGGVEGRGAHA